jgi:hypothetical protein
MLTLQSINKHIIYLKINVMMYWHNYIYLNDYFFIFIKFII